MKKKQKRKLKEKLPLVESSKIDSEKKKLIKNYTISEENVTAALEQWASSLALIGPKEHIIAWSTLGGPLMITTQKEVSN